MKAKLKASECLRDLIVKPARQEPQQGRASMNLQGQDGHVVSDSLRSLTPRSAARRGFATGT